MWTKRAIGAITLLLVLSSTLGACPKRVDEGPTTEWSVSLYGLVKGGKGSGVVGGPIEGVQVTATWQGKTVGPVYTDASGSFTLDAKPLFPPGSVETQEQMATVTPITVDLKLSKPGFKTQVETVTFPVPRFEEFVFYLEGESG